MKRFSVIFGLALGMLTVGCSQDMPEDTALPSTGDVVTLGVSISPSEEARTSLGDLVNGKYSVLWSEGDKLAVNGKTSSAVSAAQAGTTSATFTVADVKAPFNVLYPAEALNPDGTITIATEQVYTPGSFANGNAVLAGYSEDGSTVDAKHLYSFVKVNVVKGAEDVALKSVTVKALGGEAISGTFHVDYQNATITPAAGQDLVRVSSVEPIAIGNGVSFVVAVPAGTYSAGFEVTVADVDGLGMTRKVTNPAYSNIPGGLLVDMPALTYAPEIPVSIAAPITTAQQLSDFLAAASAGDISAYVMDNGEVVLGSDIDLTGVTLTPAATFTGVFNGQGYALKNWTTSSPLFTKNEGTVKNLVLDSSCSLSWAVPTAAGVGLGVVADTNVGTIAGCVNNASLTWTNGGTDLAYQVKAGVFAGINDGTLTNCVNNGAVNITLSAIDNTSTGAGATQYFGALVGTGTKQTLTNNINNGDITLSVAGTAKHGTYVAGISGAATSGGTLTSNINNGKVTANLQTAFTGGGLQVAGITAYTSATISKCYNNGEVYVTSPGKVYAPQIGGIVGYTSGKVDDCHNTGKINVVIGAGCNSKSTTASEKMTNGEKSTMPEIAGVLALGYKAELTKSTNSGHVYVEYTAPIDGSTINMVRTYVGGVAATIMGGSVDQCVNKGRMDVIVSVGEGKGLKQVYAGGVFCNSYNSNEYPTATYPELTPSPVTNCTNHGDIYFNVDHNGSNNYAGGITAQVDGEDAATSSVETTNCVNYGNIYDLGYGKDRVGGISGGAGKLTNCVNYGNISVANATASSQVGGVIGFHTSHTVTNCKNYGDVVSTSTGVVYCGGLLGQIATKNATVTGCEVNCNVEANGGAAAIAIGYTTSTNTQAHNVDLKVAGSVKTNGSSSKVTLDSSNYTEYLLGAASKTDYALTINATLLTE